LSDTKNAIIKSATTIIIAVITAGGMSLFFDSHQKKLERDDKYINKYFDVQRELSRLNGEVYELKARLLTLELASKDLPFPYWIKSLDGRIIHISQVYENVILKPLGIRESDFLGTKGELLGEEFVRIILEHDADVIRAGRVLKFRETVPGLGDGTSYKYPIGQHGSYHGTSGIWIPDDLDLR